MSLEDKHKHLSFLGPLHTIYLLTTILPIIGAIHILPLLFSFTLQITTPSAYVWLCFKVTWISFIDHLDLDIPPIFFSFSALLILISYLWKSSVLHATPWCTRSLPQTPSLQQPINYSLCLLRQQPEEKSLNLQCTKNKLLNTAQITTSEKEHGKTTINEVRPWCLRHRGKEREFYIDWNDQLQYLQHLWISRELQFSLIQQNPRKSALNTTDF